MKEMSTLKFPNQAEAYEIVDATARLNLDEKAERNHKHSVSEITDFAHEHDERYYTETETDTKLEEVKKYTDQQIANIPTPDVSGQIETHNVDTEAHPDIRSMIVQADLSQNNPLSPDYVKGRTHWIDYAETLLNAEVFECTTLASDAESYYCAKSGNIGLVSGRTYNVTVNGTTYTAEALLAFGSNDISLIAEIDTCRIYDRASGVVEVFTDSSTTLTITIVGTEDVYVQLDERFIPDVFARQADLESKMDKENPTGSGALSMNRASGSEIGENSVAIGNDCVASGDSAIAIGFGANATGFASHAEGTETVASGSLAHAEGQESVATGYASHAESSSEANGDYSHAEGYSIADGNYSHASGNGTWAIGRSQTVIGEANIEDVADDAATRGTYAVIVGNGDLETGEYSNASTLDWNGLGWFAGGLKIGGLGQDDDAALEVATKNDIPILIAATDDNIDALFA